MCINNAKCVRIFVTKPLRLDSFYSRFEEFNSSGSGKEDDIVKIIF